MEPWKLTAVQMRAALDGGALSSEELVRAHQERANAVDPLVHGFTDQYREGALAAARAADAERAAGRARGPLHGLPISLKENLGLVGTAATIGVKARLGRTATANAALVQVALDGGAVVLGKSNLPQLMLSMETENAIWGATLNPWKADRTPGGSSGGEAALIASGCSPLGIGTDIGGSIRNPAAWSGICGLKPTAGRWSMAGIAGGQPGQEAVRGQSGPMARTVDDLILLMQALSPAAQHAADPTTSPLPFPNPASVDLRSLVVGVYEEDEVMRPAASVRRAVREAAKALEEAGVRVVPYTPPRSWEMAETFFALMGADGFVTATQGIEGEPWTQQMATVAKLAKAPRALRAVLSRALGIAGQGRLGRIMAAAGERRLHEAWALVVRRNALRAAELAAWQSQGLHALVGPPAITPAAIRNATHDWSLGAWPTMRWNLLDFPAGVVPVSTVQASETDRPERADRLDTKAATFEATSAGLPVAAQVIGRPWEEHVVLALLRAIEQGRDPALAPRTPVDPFPLG